MQYVCTSHQYETIVSHLTTTIPLFDMLFDDEIYVYFILLNKFPVCINTMRLPLFGVGARKLNEKLVEFKQTVHNTQHFSLLFIFAFKNYV